MRRHDDIELVLDQELQTVRDALSDEGKYFEAAEVVGLAEGWGGSPDPFTRREDWRARLCRKFAPNWQRRSAGRRMATLADYVRVCRVLGYSPIDFSKFTAA